MDFRTRVWQQSRKNHQWSQLNIIWMKTEMNMHIHTWSPSWRNGNCSKRPSRSCGSSRIALHRIANVRSIKLVTTCWLRRALVNSTWSNRQCLSKDTESSPGSGKGCASDCVIPGLFFLGDFLVLVFNFPLSTGVLRNSLKRFLREVTIAPWKSNAEKTNNKK